MIAFPNCKINLGLRVLQKRGDGFHDIETAFYPVGLRDVLEIVPAPAGQQGPTINNYGLPVKGETADNLCLKAWHLLKNDFRDLPGVEIHLLKNIPMGAGLGGGSADGAFMLRLLNEKFNLGLSIERMRDYALQLGSDCPFFIVNTPVFASGRGEQLSPAIIDLSSWQLVLVNPGIHVPTGWAFGQLKINSPLTKSIPLQQIIMQPVSSWKRQLLNDFEKPVFEKYPEIKRVKEKLYQLGAVYASMSGSGSTVFGLFNHQKNLAPILPDTYRLIRL